MTLSEFGRYPVFTFILIATIGTSLLVWNNEHLYRMFILHPYSVIRQKRYYTLFTSGLIHADGGHLLFNMITFYFFGRALEALMGSAQLAILYVISLVVSDIPTLIKQRDNPDYFCLGASGAVSAVIFSIIIFRPLSRIYFFFIPVGIPAALFGVLYVAYTYYSSRNVRSHINHSAHLWGAISGLVLTAVLAPQAYRGFFETLRSFLERVA
jgi:membrane associated rhomboid family serine protease